MRLLGAIFAAILAMNFGFSTCANAGPDVKIQLTYPAGKSPKVFTKGWMFGAKATADGKDISSKVKWSGTAKFSPAAGTISRPSFKKAGSNTIILSVDYSGEHYSKKFSIKAVSPDKYAAMGDTASCPSDSHGCVGCPHSVSGKIIQGSPHVMVRGKPAARKGDRGHAVQCCGPNTFTVAGGDPTVLIDGRPAARKGDKTDHCGGTGKIGGAAAYKGEEEVFSGPAGPSKVKLILVQSTVRGSLTSTQPGVRSTGTITGSYNRKTGKITANISGTTRVTMNGESGSSKWSGPLTAKRVDDTVEGTFKMRVSAGGTSMSDNIPVKLTRVK